MKSKSILFTTLLYIFILSFFVTIFVKNVTFPLLILDQFSYLAQAFLQGHTFFLENPGFWTDTVFFNGQHYWPLGVFPAILLLPFVFVCNMFGFVFKQGFLQPFFVISIYSVLYKISRFYNYSKNDSLILAFGFTFSSVLIIVNAVPSSWYFSQVIAVFLIVLFIYEYLTKRRYILLGLLSGCAFLTRTSLLFIGVFILLEILLLSKVNVKNKIKDVLFYVLPLSLCIAIFFAYNYIRFGNIFEQGYLYQILFTEELYKAREYGVLSLVHVPGNLFYFLLSLPLPIFNDEVSHVLKFPYVKADPWGMSIFVTSPYFLYLFLLKYKDRLSIIIWITILCIATPIFLYYGVGYRQFGYRYSLDFLPFLFWLFVLNLRKSKKELPFSLKLLLLVPAFTNLLLSITLP